MGIRREPGRVIFELNTSGLQMSAIVLLGAVAGVVLFLAFKPFAPDIGSFGDSEPAKDSVAWSEAPHFDVVIAGRPSIGMPDAPVTIVEFADYGCPYCRRHALEVLPTLLDTMGIGVQYVVRHFPIPALTSNAISAAIAAECAFKQGLFWEYKAALQAEAVGFQLERLRTHAASVGLGSGVFENCIEDEQTRSIVERDILDGWGYGVTGTPTFFINGKRFQGARPLAELVEYVRLALLDADSSVSKR